MKLKIWVVFCLLLFIYGCGGGDDGGTSGGSGSVQQLNAGNLVGNWYINETYKDGTSKQWRASFETGGRFTGGGGVWDISDDGLVIQNPYSYWVAEDLSNSKKFVAYGPVSNLSFSRSGQQN